MKAQQLLTKGFSEYHRHLLSFYLTSLHHDACWERKPLTTDCTVRKLFCLPIQKKRKKNNCNLSKGITIEFKDIGWYYNLLCLRLVTNHANVSASIKNFGFTKKWFTEEFFITSNKYHTLHLGHKIPNATYSALHSLCHAWWYFTEFSTSVERSSSVESMYYKRKICSKIVFSSTERATHTI